MNKNFYALIESRAAGRAEKICLNCDNGSQFSNGDLLELTARISRYIRSEGLKPGDRLVVQVPKSAFAVALYLACLRSGVIYIPLNTSYTPEEVSYFLGDATPKLFICDPANQENLSAVATQHGASVLTLDVNGEASLPERIEGLVPDNEITK